MRQAPLTVKRPPLPPPREVRDPLEGFASGFLFGGAAGLMLLVVALFVEWVMR